MNKRNLTRLFKEATELAGLSYDYIKAVYNMKFLEESSEAKKKSSCAFSLKIDARKVIEPLRELARKQL